MTYSQFFYGLLTAAITAPLAAWLTARFALRRFYAEKVWERKVDAYTAIMEALHEMRRWYEIHWDAQVEQRSLSEEQKDALVNDYRNANRNLERRVDSEKWIISDECVEILGRMQKILRVSYDDWFNYIDNGNAAVNAAMRELLPVIRRDLGVEHDRASVLKLFR
jgi:hypothetical protein